MKFLKILLLTFIWLTSYGTLAGNAQQLENGLYAGMKTTKGENVSTTFDVWCDIQKIEYHNDGEMIIYYTEKDEKSS